MNPYTFLSIVDEKWENGVSPTLLLESRSTCSLRLKSRARMRVHNNSNALKRKREEIVWRIDHNFVKTKEVNAF